VDPPEEEADDTEEEDFDLGDEAEDMEVDQGYQSPEEDIFE
jgi:hypothetical protein